MEIFMNQYTTEAAANDMRIGDFMRLLSWKGNDELLRYLITLQVRWSYQQLSRWSEHCNMELNKTIRALPTTTQKRLILAPEFFCLLFESNSPTSSDLGRLSSFIAAECAIADKSMPTHCPLWSALGDRYWDFSGGRQCKLQLQAPTINNIVIDLKSSHYNSSYLAAYGVVRRYAGIESDLLIQKLLEAFDVIRAITPHAERIVTTAAQVINIVKAPESTMRLSSMSRRSVIGMITLINLHLDEWTPERIADALVHESIHSTLYKMELDYDFYTDDELAHIIYAKSPWSGRMLFVHSFVHACFVWFGLWNFWKEAGDTKPQTIVLRERARRGFAAGHPLDQISEEARSVIHPTLKECIDSLYLQIRPEVR